MKTRLFAIVAIATLFASCAKEIDTIEKTPEGKRLVTITGNITKTKTTVTDAGIYSWSSGEQIAVAEQEMYDADPILFDLQDADAGTFSGTLTSGKEPIFAVSPAFAVSDITEISGDILYTITLDNVNNYVPGTSNALMVAGDPVKNGDDYTFQFRHAAAVIKVPVVNIPVGTAKVKLTMDKKITGIWESLITVNPIPEINPGTASLEGENYVILNLKDVITTPNTSADFYFSVPANTYESFQFELLDAGNNKLKGVKKNGLSITLGVADLFITPTITLPKVYTKVTTEPSDWSGTYLIVFEGANVNSTDVPPVALDGSLTTLEASNNGVAVSISGGDIYGSTEIDAATFVIQSVTGGYSIRSAQGSYIGHTGGSNSLAQSENDDYVNSISLASDGSVSISCGSYYLRYNASSGQYRFRYYSSSTSQKPVYLYKLGGSGPAPVEDNRTTVTLSFAPANPSDIDLADSFTEPTLTVDPVAATFSVVYSVTTDPANIATIDASTGDLTITAAGEITVTAAIPNNDATYKPVSVSYTLTVTNNNATPDKYGLVEEEGAFEDGGQYVFILPDGADPSTYYALYTYRSLEFAGLTITNDEIIDPDDKYIFVAEAGSESGKFALKNLDTGKYFPAATGTTPAASSTAVDITLGYLSASKAYQINTGTRSLVYYASTPDVRFYANSNFHDQIEAGTALATNDGAFKVYKLGYTTKTPFTTPTGLSVSGKTLSWTPVEGAASYNVTVGTVVANGLTEASYTFTGTDDYYNVSVVAVPSNTGTYKNSLPATLTDACFGTPTLATPVLTAGALEEDSVQATWTVDSRATNGYYATITLKDNATIIDSKTVNAGSVIFDGLDGDTDYTVSVYAIAVTGAKAYAQSGVDSINLTTQEATTIAMVIAGGGSGSYAVSNVTVFATPTNSTAIIGDSTGKVLYFTGNNSTAHGLAVGDVITINGSTTLYNGVVEFTGAPASTITKITTTSVNHGSATALSSENITSWAGSPSSIVYVSGKGKQTDNQNITTFGKVLHLNAANSATNGKYVEFSGYIYGWSTSYNNFNFVVVDDALAEASDAPEFEVSPTSKTWGFDETDEVEFAVTANNGTWDYSPKSLTWATVMKDGNSIKVTPNDENDGNSNYTGTITVTFTPSYAGYTVEPIGISLTQEYDSGTPSLTKGTSWTYTFPDSSHKLTTTATAFNGLTWKASTNATWDSQSGDANRGNSWSKPDGVTVECSDYSGGIESISLVMSSNTTGTTVGVTVGGIALSTDDTLGKENNKTLTFTTSELLAGTIVITITNTNKSVMLKTISVN